MKTRNDSQFIYDEAYETIKKFHEVFGTKEGRGSWLDARTSHIDDCILELKGLRLRTYIVNNFGNDIYKGKYFSLWSKTEKSYKHYKEGYPVLKSRHSKVIKSKDCVLTGVCYDMYILDELYKFIENYREYPSADYQTFQDLIEYSFDSLKKSIKDEIEAIESEEYIID